MTLETTCFLTIIVIGIFAVQVTSAQRGQGSSRALSERGRIPRYFRVRGSPPGSRTRSSRRQALPGPQHLQSASTRSRAQRLSNVRGRGLIRRPEITGTNRLTSEGTRRMLSRPSNNARYLAALRRQPQPTKTARTQPSKTRNLPLLGLKPSMINEQLSIFARNLEVIDGTIGLTRSPTSVKTGPSKDETASSKGKTTPKKTTQTSRSKGIMPKNSRTTARTAVTTERGRGKTTGNRIAPPTKSPIKNSRLRIRARLRQISGTAPETARSKASDQSNINTRNIGGGNKNSGGGNAPGRRRDMVAIDDIISLVNAIRGGKQTRPVAHQGKTNIATPRISNTKTNSIRENKASSTISPNVHSKGSSKKMGNRKSKKLGSNNNKALRNNNKRISSTLGKQSSASANKRNFLGSPMNMFAQLALMSGGGENGMNGGESGGLFSDMLSNPAFLNQMSAGGSENNLMQMFAGSGIPGTGKKGRSVLSKENMELNVNQSVLKGLNAIKLNKTGNPVQDQMISSLLDQTMKHLREEIQENIRKRLSEGDSPPSSIERTTGAQVPIVSSLPW